MRSQRSRLKPCDLLDSLHFVAQVVLFLVFEMERRHCMRETQISVLPQYNRAESFPIPSSIPFCLRFLPRACESIDLIIYNALSHDIMSLGGF